MPRLSPGEPGAARDRRDVTADRRRACNARPDRGRARDLPDGLQHQPQAREDPPRRGAPSSTPTTWTGPSPRPSRRLARPRGDAGAPGRPGHPARHVQPAPRRARRHEHRDGVYSSSRTSTPAGPFMLYDSVLSEYAALGFEYGYSVAEPDRLVVLGGAVRRLHQRRADHHRPVHRGRRGQVGPDRRAHAAAPPRLRGPGPGALERADRTVPRAVRGGQHPGRATRRPRRSTSTCSGASRRRSPASRSSASPPSATSACRRPVRHVGDLTSGAFHEMLDDPSPTSTPRPCGGCCCARASSATS